MSDLSRNTPPHELMEMVKQPLDSDRRAPPPFTLSVFAFLGIVLGGCLIFTLIYMLSQ